MDGRPSSTPIRRVLWRTVLVGSEEYPVGTRYWWENLPREPASQASIQLTVAGRIRVRIGTEEFEAGPGSLTFIVHGSDTAYGCRSPLAEPYACRWLSFAGAGLHALLKSLLHEFGPVQSLGAGSPLVRGFESLHRKLGVAGSVRAVEEARLLHGYLMDLTEFLEEARNAESPPVERGVRKILEEPLLPWSADEYAQWAGCSREHLSRVFRARTGGRIQDFLIGERTDRAKLLLRETQFPVLEVVKRSGFASYHAMARNLRRREGAGPMECRASARAPRDTPR